MHQTADEFPLRFRRRRHTFTYPHRYTVILKYVFFSVVRSKPDTRHQTFRDEAIFLSSFSSGPFLLFQVKNYDVNTKDYDGD